MLFVVVVFFKQELLKWAWKIRWWINNLRDDVRVHEIWCFFHRPAICTAVIHPKTVFEAVKNATKPESKDVSFLEKHSHHRHHPRHQKCAGISQLENLSLGLTNSAAKVIFLYKKKLHGNTGMCKSQTGVVFSAERGAQSPAATGSLWRHYELLSLATFLHFPARNCNNRAY